MWLLGVDFPLWLQGYVGSNQQFSVLYSTGHSSNVSNSSVSGHIADLLCCVKYIQ